MLYRIRVILDSKEDVIRDFEISDNNTFEELHLAIINCFEFDGKEMASFYISDEEWKQGQEIVLDNFFEGNNELLMKETKLNSIVNENQKKFIYIYDFLKLWTFFVEIFEIKKQKKNTIYPKYIFSNRTIPINAPEKIFVADKNDKDFSVDEFGYDSYY